MEAEKGTFLTIPHLWKTCRAKKGTLQSKLKTRGAGFHKCSTKLCSASFERVCSVSSPQVLHDFCLALQSAFLDSIYKLSKSVLWLKLLGFHAHGKTFNLPNSKRMIVSYITRTCGKPNLQIKKSK